MKTKTIYIAIFCIVALSGAIFFLQFERVIKYQKQQTTENQLGEKYIPDPNRIPSNEINKVNPVDDTSKGPLNWKTQFINSALQIQLPERDPDFLDPSIQDNPFFAKKDGFESVDLYPYDLKNPIHFSAIASLGFADTSDQQIRFQSAFYIFKAKVDLKNIKLIDWIAQSQKNTWNTDFPVSDLLKLQAMNRELKTSRSTELVYFHLPAPSDNGWYAYRNGDAMYLFSMGNNSWDTRGAREGLWDKMMETIAPYTIPMNQARNINNLKTVSGKSDMVWYPITELGIEIKVKRAIANELVYQVSKWSPDQDILSASFTTKRLLEIGEKLYGKKIEARGSYVCHIGSFTRFNMSEEEFAARQKDTYGDDFVMPKSIDGYFVRYDSPQAYCSQSASDGEYEQYVVTNWWGMPTSEYTENTDFNQVVRDSVRRIK